MDDTNCLAQGSTDEQSQVTDMLLQGIKEIFMYPPLDLKDSVSLKKSQKGDGDWAVEKEILGCILNSEKGTFQLPSCRLKELKS